MPEKRKPSVVTRKQLGEFLSDHRAIRAFEQMVSQVANELPDAIEQELRSSPTDAKAQQALDAVIRIADALDRIASAPVNEPLQQYRADYIDFALNAPSADVPRRVAWNPADDTLNIHHSDGNVVQQVGQESYSRATNRTASTIPNATVVGLSGLGSGGPVGCAPYIADGSTPSFYILGVTTEAIPAGAIGFVTVRGLIHDIDTTGTPYGETWNVGDILYPSPTVAGRLTNVKPTAPNLVIPCAAVIVKDASLGVIAVRPTVFLQLYYGSFYNATSQTAGLINTPYAATFPSTSTSSGVSITSSSRITVANSGVYEFSFNAQAAKTTAAVGYIWFWIRKNGADVANTTMRLAIQGSTAENVFSRTFSQSMAAGDYIELMWAVDSTATYLAAAVSSAFAPATPSVTVVVSQINQ